MYQFYYLHTVLNANDCHELHAEGCPLTPPSYERDYLGMHINYEAAIQTAHKKHFPKVETCPLCINTKSN